MTDPAHRKPKKSESVEVRLPYELKQDFLAACEAEKRTVSDKVRGWIEDFVAERKQPAHEPAAGKIVAMIPKPIRKKRYLAAAAGLAGAAVFIAMPSAANTDPMAVFLRMDRNGDGVVAADEFMGGQAGGAAGVAETRARIARDAAVRSPDEPRVIQLSFAFLSPPEALAADADWVISLQVGLIVSDWEADESGKRPSEPPDNNLAYEFVATDANRDGVVSAAEYGVRMQSLLSRGFELLDVDGDGRLDRVEFAAYRDGALLDARNFGGPRNPRVTLPEPTPPDAETDAAFGLIDANGDGRVSLAEYLAKA